jgi:hypothetical protein
MAVTTSATLHLVETDYSTGFGRGRTGMLKTYGERANITERRRVIVGDFSGERRAQDFLSAGRENHAPSRRSVVSRLRQMESKVVLLDAMLDLVSGISNSLATRYNPFCSYQTQVRVKSKSRK